MAVADRASFAGALEAFVFDAACHLQGTLGAAGEEGPRAVPYVAADAYDVASVELVLKEGFQVLHPQLPPQLATYTRRTLQESLADVH